jgi:hypothetical protein
MRPLVVLVIFCGCSQPPAPGADEAAGDLSVGADLSVATDLSVARDLAARPSASADLAIANDLATSGVSPDLASARDLDALPVTQAMLLADGDPATVRIPAWDAVHPRPLTILAHYQSAVINNWLPAAADINSDGSISKLDNGSDPIDRIRVFGYPDVDPLLVADQAPPITMPHWNNASPAPVIVAARYSGTDRWSIPRTVFDIAGNDSDFVNADRVMAWSFAAPPAPIYDGAFKSNMLHGWDPTGPYAIVVMSTNIYGSDWAIGLMDTVQANGVIYPASWDDRLRVWRF